jgi:urate oxidase
MAPQQFPLVKHCHGKSRVRVGRVWRLPNGTHLFSELSCEVLLESPMEKAFTAGDNSGMTATDTVKNNIYKVAKGQSKPVSADAFAVALAEHFVRTYPLVRTPCVALAARAPLGGAPPIVSSGAGSTHLWLTRCVCGTRR